MTRIVAFGDLRVLVEGVEGSHAAWLAEFLGPHFDVARPGAPVDRQDAAGDAACRVRLIEDRSRYEAALAAGPSGGASDAFVFDTRIVTLPRWRGGELRLFDAKWQLFYEVGGPPLAVTIVSAPGNRRVRSAVVDVVRELTTNHAQRAGDVLLHASAFAVDGRGVIAGGPKRAGKTTLLVHALSEGSAEYVANDRVLVPAAGAPYARGVPTSVGLRRETLDLFPALAERVFAAGYEQLSTLDEAASAESRATRGRGRRLTPAQLCAALGVPARAGCAIASAVFPRVTGEPGAFSLRRLDPAETSLRLEGALFGVGQGRWTSDVFSLAGDPPPRARAALAAACRALADRVPGFECLLGLDAYVDAGARKELLAALLP